MYPKQFIMVMERDGGCARKEGSCLLVVDIKDFRMGRIKLYLKMCIIKYLCLDGRFSVVVVIGAIS